jgi:mannan endo-1,4-beta-mannosidase
VPAAAGCQSNGKLFLEEWGIDASAADQRSAAVSEVNDMNSADVPSLYWQILYPALSDCPYNPSQDEGNKFRNFYDSGADLAGPIDGAAGGAAAQDWTGSVY